MNSSILTLSGSITPPLQSRGHISVTRGFTNGRRVGGPRSGTLKFTRPRPSTQAETRWLSWGV
jgi:hypothetical protein